MNDSAAAILAEADQLMINVPTRHGPHVTPELFAFDNGRLWCLTAASTLKARNLARGGRVGIAACAGGRAIVLTGDAVVLDPAHPARSVSQLADESHNHGPATLAGASRAVARFAFENAAELTGAAVAAVTGRLGRPLPPHRVLIAIEPDATATIDEAGEVDAAGWVPETGRSGPEATDDATLVEDLLEAVPERLRDLASDGPAFLGWTTLAGEPVVVPATWHRSQSRAALSARLVEAIGAAPHARVALTRDEWTGFGPLGKQGLMLRGDGELRTEHGECAVDVNVDAVTYWDGIQTGSATSE